MGEKSIALHFTHTDTTTLLTTLDGLASRRHDRTSGTHLVLVVNHVTQTLVVDDTDVNVRLELLARDARVERLVAVVVVAGLHELVAKVVAGRVLLVELEGRRVLRESVQGTGLAGERLDEHTDCHARRESVRVDDDVGLDASLREGHVDGAPLLRAHTLLTVTRRELVTDDGRTGDAKLDGDGL